MSVDHTDRSLGIALAKTASIDEKKIVDETTHAEDDYIPNSEGVTKHEYNTLRHVGDTLPMSAWLAAAVEFAERYGITFT
jgi:POT family proton-dependent oligopeptide transporter